MPYAIGPLSCLSVCPVCNIDRVLWPNLWMDLDETWHAGRPRPWLHCVRWELSSPPPKGHITSPQFLAYICCGQMAGWIKMPLHREVGLIPSDIVLDRDPAPPLQKRDSPPIFGPCLCGQTAGWITMPLGMAVSLSPGHIVLDGTQLPFPKRGTAPNFRPLSVVAKRLDGSRCHLVRR